MLSVVADQNSIGEKACLDTVSVCHEKVSPTSKSLEAIYESHLFVLCYLSRS
jgi:hypothetical protein